MKITIKSADTFQTALERLGKEADGICKMAVYEGAAVVADAIQQGIEGLPTDKFRYLRGGDAFAGVTAEQKQDLKASLGVAPMQADGNGGWNTKIGFDGYGHGKTRHYPNGLPNALLARAVESGSSVRVKTPFVRSAVNRSRAKAKKAMTAKFEEEMKKIMK